MSESTDCEEFDLEDEQSPKVSFFFRKLDCCVGFYDSFYPKNREENAFENPLIG